MAVPKAKTSKQRKHKRSANWKLNTPNLSTCPQCHSKKENHRVCPTCGYYDGVLVVEMNDEKSKKN